MIPKPLTTVIIVVVTVVWAGNFVASVFVPGYEFNSSYNFIFMAIVGSTIALSQDGTGSTMARVISALRPPAAKSPENDKRDEDKT